MTAAPTKAARLAREQSAASRQKYTLEGETLSTRGLAKDWEREAACGVGDWPVVKYESAERAPIGDFEVQIDVCAWMSALSASSAVLDGARQYRHSKYM